jgi:hypothetical protein
MVRKAVRMSTGFRKRGIGITTLRLIFVPIVDASPETLF